VNRLASALRAAGLRKGDRVAFLCPNTPALLEAHYGVPAAGGVLVALNYRLNADDIGYILKHSGARFLFADHEFEYLAKGAKVKRAVRIDDTGDPGDPYEAFLAEGSPDPVASKLGDESETISINYTSGTTGRPKGKGENTSPVTCGPLRSRSSVNCPRPPPARSRKRHSGRRNGRDAAAGSASARRPAPRRAAPRSGRPGR
jgi:acyl-coenzyme A synthetase/AMP-(fatty) acid ligase